MSAIITMRHIAAQAGVSIATVSLALRNHASIPATTRNRIQAIAEKLGYRPNPMVAALMAQLRPKRRRKALETLAYLDSEPVAPPAVAPPTLFMKSASRRALELGYKVERFSLANLPVARLSKILYTRNIQGVILAPFRTVGSTLNLPWPHLSSVTMGYSLQAPYLHHICSNHYKCMSLALERVSRLGYKRIGLALTPDILVRCQNIWMGSYCAWQQTVEPTRRLQPLIVENHEKGKIAAWLKQERPQAILYLELPVPEVLQSLPLNKARDILAVHLDCTPSMNVLGINQRWEVMGEAATNLVVAQLHRNERGIPDNPTTTLVEGEWFDPASRPQ